MPDTARVRRLLTDLAKVTCLCGCFAWNPVSRNSLENKRYDTRDHSILSHFFYVSPSDGCAGPMKDIHGRGRILAFLAGALLSTHWGMPRGWKRRGR